MWIGTHDVMPFESTLSVLVPVSYPELVAQLELMSDMSQVILQSLSLTCMVPWYCLLFILMNPLHAFLALSTERKPLTASRAANNLARSRVVVC